MSSKQEAFDALMKQILAFMERFKYIDKAIENLCKSLCKVGVSNSEFNEMLKMYNTTSQMFVKSLEIMDNMISKFPQELSPEEIEVLDLYRSMNEAEKFMYRVKIKEVLKNATR